jgi:hypothetical protein
VIVTPLNVFDLLNESYLLSSVHMDGWNLNAAFFSANCFGVVFKET